MTAATLPLVEFLRRRCPVCESANLRLISNKGEIRYYQCREKKCRQKFKARVR